MNKSYKFRIYPNPAQEVMLMKTFGCVRFIYNKMLADREAYFAETGKHLNLPPARYKTEFEFLNEVDSCALNWAEKALTTAYRNHFESGADLPQRKSNRDRGHLSYTTSRTRGNIKFVDGYLQLPKLGLVKIVQHRIIPEGYDLKAVTVSKVPSGKYFVSILFEYQEDIVEVEPKTFVGLDYSIKNLYVSSDGECAQTAQHGRAMKEKLSKEYRKLNRCQRGSKNHEKKRQAVAKVYEKIANQRKDALHKDSKRFAQTFDCVSVEELNMKKMAKAYNFKASVADGSYGAFLKNLEYKLKWQGKRFVKVNKWFPSSKTCSHCGTVKVDLKLSDRTFKCKDCGTIMDRDLNAAINIKREGERIVLQP